MEFFLVIPLILLVLVAGLQGVGMAVTQLELVGAARDGARTAATTPDPARAVEAVLASLPPSMRDRVRVSVARPSVVGQPDRVEVRVRHEFGAPFPAGMGIGLVASSSMLVER